MAVTLEEFSRLISGIYNAVLDDSRWGETLQQLVDVMGGTAGALLTTEPRLRSIASAAVGTDPVAIKAYNDYYGRMDPVASAIERASAGSVLSVLDTISPDEHRRSEFFNDWAAPTRVGDGVLAGLMHDEGRTAWLNIAAPLRPQPFGAPERLELMRLLVPHLQQAIRCQMRLGLQARELQNALEALDRLVHGVVLLGDSGRASFVNAAARRIFESGDGLLLRSDGSVHALLAPEDGTLRRVMGHAAIGDGDNVRSAGCLTISRPSGRRSFVVHALPVGHGTYVSASSMLLIVDPEREPQPPLGLMRHVYGLTRAEALVATSIGRGEGLKSVADELSVSVSTVRIHLQRVFEKTGTHRQAELVRLLMAVQAGVDGTQALP